MGKHRRTYTYSVTVRGKDHLMRQCGNIPDGISDSVTFADNWCIYRRHDTKHSPWNFELWINDTMFVDRWTAKTMRRWRKFGYIAPHADTWHIHVRRVNKLLHELHTEKEQEE